MRRSSVLVLVGLAALTVAAYSRLWENNFVNLDDEDWITLNPHVREGLSAHAVQWAWTTYYQGNWVPLTWMSLQLDASLSPTVPGGGHVLAPAVFHAQNLFWHLASVLLLFAALWQLSGSVAGSAFVAALFAVHPLHVESVAWASERKDVLSAFFLTLTLLAYGWYAKGPTVLRYLSVLAAFVLGLLAKPMLVSLPFILLLLDYWPLRRWGWPASQKSPLPRKASRKVLSSPSRRGEFLPAWWGLGLRILEKVPLLAVAIVACAVTLVAQRAAGAMQLAERVSWPDRLANAVLSYGWYLEKTFWPTDLASFYPHALGQWSWGLVLLCSTLLVAITAAVLATSRRWPWQVVGWLWFVGTLVPVIGLVQVGGQSRADRYTYIPHIGLFVALTWSAAVVLDRWRVPATARAVAAAVCLIPLAVLTWLQVGIWHDSQTLWEHALALTHGNYMAHANLANYLSERGCVEGKPELLARALKEYDRAIALQPDDFRYRYNVGALLLTLGEPAAAQVRFLQALKLDPRFDMARVSLALARLQCGQQAEAAQTLRQALAINPSASSAQALLGRVLWEQGHHEEAIAQWQAALRGQPNEPEALTGMGKALLRQGQPQAAALHFRRALMVQSTPARWSLCGVALGRMGDWQAAVAAQEWAVRAEEGRQHIVLKPVRTDLVCYHCRWAHALRAAGAADASAQEYARASELDPGWPRAAEAEAWRLATDPDPAVRDPASARELAEQVCEAQANPPAEALDALAAAQAACGHYSDATAAARKAQAKASGTLARAITERLHLYEQGKPYVAATSSGH